MAYIKQELTLKNTSCTGNNPMLYDCRERMSLCSLLHALYHSCCSHLKHRLFEFGP